MKAAIVSIGSELLAGQILNRNAPWISEKLFELGVDTAFQITVDDQLEAIVEALNLARSKGSMVFCTGGLGPTSDDITRESVAQWLKKSLVYDSASWEHIVNVFTRFGTKPPEGNRRQCYFPEGARILTNRAGTAHGFYIRNVMTPIFVLPGPPTEIAAIWQAHIGQILREEILPDIYNMKSPKIFRSWRTIGKGESHIAEVVEKVCRPLLSENLIEVAYRAHAPIIETKIRFEPTNRDRVETVLNDLTTAFSPYLYEIQSENWAETLISHLLKVSQPITIYDGWTRGCIQSLLTPKLTKVTFHTPKLGVTSVTSWPERSIKEFKELGLGETQDCILAVYPHQETSENGVELQWDVVLHHGKQLVHELFDLPFKVQAPRERQESAVAALAIKFWAQKFNMIFGEI